MLALFMGRVYCWLMLKLVSIRAPRYFSAMLLSSWVTLSLYWGLGLFLQGQYFVLPLLKRMRFLSAYFSSLLRSLHSVLLEDLLKSVWNQKVLSHHFQLPKRD